MISDEGSDSDFEPPTESSNPVPNKSSDLLLYKRFMEWKEGNNKQSLTEEVFMDYFKELAEKSKPVTLWSHFLMLKPTMKANENLDIDTFDELKSFLMTKSVGLKRKPINILTSREIEMFLDHAPDDRFLIEKVLIIFGILGACRSQELVHMSIDNIKDDGKMARVTIPETDCGPERTFELCDEFYKMYKKYRALRLKETDRRRLFLKYKNGKCVNEVIGFQKVATVPKVIVRFLNLPDPEGYTGQQNTFRKTAAALLAESGAYYTSLQCELGRNSEIVKDLMEENERKRIKISKQITEYIFPKPSTSSGSDGAASTQAGDVGEPLFVACDVCTGNSEVNEEQVKDSAEDQRRNDPRELSVAQEVGSTAEESNVQGQGSGKPSGGQPVDKLVCLQWSNHQSNIQTSFPSFLNSEDFVDVTLACEGKSVKCHKVIISSCSEYLSSLLRENPCQHPIILMKDIKFWEVEALVEFMYKGEVNIPHDKLPQLLKAAEALQVKGLSNFAPVEIQSIPPSMVPTLTPQPLEPPSTTPPKPPEPETPKPPSKASSTPQLSTKCAMEDPIETQKSNNPPIVAKYPRQRAYSPPPLRSPSPEIKIESLDITTDIFAVNSSTSEFNNFDTFNERLGNHQPEPGDAVQHQTEDMNDVQERGDLLFDDFPNQERQFLEMDSGYSLVVPPDDDQHTHKHRRSNKKRKRKHDDRDIPRKRL